MANTHVQTIDGEELGTIVHFAVPDTVNAFNVNWRTVAARIYGTTTLADGDGKDGTITPEEKDQILAGALVEQSHIFKLGTKEPTKPQLDSAFDEAQAKWLAAFQTKYNLYGFTQ
jgi:hypothetical protein